MWKIGSIGGVGGATTWLPIFYIFNSDVFPVELKNPPGSIGSKSAAEKIGAWQGLEESDRRWRWTNSIKGEPSLLPG
jgi:hypothetical protein